MTHLAEMLSSLMLDNLILTSVQIIGQFGIVTECGDGIAQIDLGIKAGLATIAHHHGQDFIGALAQSFGDRPQELRAHGGWRLGPASKCLRSCRSGRVDIVLAAGTNFPKLFTRRRVTDAQNLIA